MTRPAKKRPIRRSTPRKTSSSPSAVFFAASLAPCPRAPAVAMADSDIGRPTDWPVFLSGVARNGRPERVRPGLLLPEVATLLLGEAPLDLPTAGAPALLSIRNHDAAALAVLPRP